VVSCENGQGLQHGDSRFYNVGLALPIATGYHTSHADILTAEKSSSTFFENANSRHSCDIQSVNGESIKNPPLLPFCVWVLVWPIW